MSFNSPLFQAYFIGQSFFYMKGFALIDVMLFKACHFMTFEFFTIMGNKVWKELKRIVCYRKMEKKKIENYFLLRKNGRSGHFANLHMWHNLLHKLNVQYVYLVKLQRNKVTGL